MKNTVFFLLGLAATIFAQDDQSSVGSSGTTTVTPASNYLTLKPTSSIIFLSFQSGVYTIPVFDPSNKLTYGAPNTPVQTHTSKPEHETKNSTTPTSSPTSKAPVSVSSAPASNIPSSSEASTTTESSAPSPTSSTAPQESPAAARALYPEIFGVAIGGLMAGLALA